MGAQQRRWKQTWAFKDVRQTDGRTGAQRGVTCLLPHCIKLTDSGLLLPKLAVFAWGLAAPPCAGNKVVLYPKYRTYRQ